MCVKVSDQLYGNRKLGIEASTFLVTVYQLNNSGTQYQISEHNLNQ